MTHRGLSPDHHEEINHPRQEDFWEVKGITREERIMQLRQEYIDNEVAQQQLDVYSLEENYTKRLDEYIRALKSGNQELCDHLLNNLRRDYPGLADTR